MGRLDPATRGKLLETLVVLPVLDDASGRSALLLDLPLALRSTISHSPVKRADLAAILDACERWTPLPDTTDPLLLLIDAAATLVAGSQTEQALRALRDRVAYEREGTRPAAPSPYRGLFAFREEDAPLFFGRESFTARLAEATQKQALVAVIGPSGSGKSSVVYAGLVPRLRPDPGWLIAPHAENYSFRPGDRPFRALAATLLPLLEPGLNEIQRLDWAPALEARLREGKIALRDVVERIRQKHDPPRRLLLVADQFEELFTQCRDPAERERFLDVLLAAVPPPQPGVTGAPGLSLILTLRADFFGHALAYRPLADALQTAGLNLGPMTRAELQAAVERPAQAREVAVEEGLTTRLLDAVTGEPGRLPLLEFTLTLLWERQAGGKLTHAAYEAIGGVEGALAGHAESVYNQLSTEEQQQARRIFIQLVQPGEGAPDTRRLARRTEVGDAAWPLVARLAGERLVVTSRDDASGEDRVEVVHETLITQWSRLRGWLQEDREFRAWQERLRQDLRDWLKNSRDEGALLRGALLATAEDWLARRPTDLSPPEQEFIAASVQQREAVAQEEEADRWRELDQAAALAAEQQRRLAEQEQSNRRLRARAWALFALMVVGALIALLALVQWRAATAAQATAEAGGRVARGQALAAQALAQLDRDPELSVLLAMEAVSVTRRLGEPIVPQAEDTLHQVLWRWPLVTVMVPSTRTVQSVAWSPDGRSLLSAGADGTARIWDAMSGQARAILRGHTKEVWNAAWSPDGRSIVTAGDDGTARVWDAAGGQERAVLRGHSEAVVQAHWSPDGRSIVTAGADGTARVWDAGGQERVVFKGHAAWVNSAAWSPDGQLIVTSSDDTTVRVWNAVSGQEQMVLRGHSASVWSAAWSPNGLGILTVSSDDTARVWNVATGQEQSVLQGRDERVFAAAWSPDSRQIVTTSWEGPVRIWNADEQEQVVLPGHKGVVTYAAWSPDGQYIATGGGDPIISGGDGTVRVWAVAGGQERVALHDPGGAGSSAAWSLDGQRIATVGKETAQIWEAASGQKQIELRGHGNTIHAVAWRPDGRQIVTAGEDDTARVWDAVTGQERAILRGHTDGIYGVAWSPDGRFIATASQDTTARVWNAATGREVMAFAGHNGQVDSVVWSSDGQTIMTAGNDFTVRVWNATTGQEQLILRQTNTMNSAVWRADGQRILTAGDDGTARVWSAQGQQQLVLRGHSGAVKSAAWSPNGQWIVTAGDDRTARLWHAAGGQQQAVLRGSTVPLTGAVWSPDGRYIAVSGEDGTVRRYIINMDELLALATSRLTRTLTPEERNVYLGDALPTPTPLPPSPTP